MSTIQRKGQSSFCCGYPSWGSRSTTFKTSLRLGRERFVHRLSLLFTCGTPSIRLIACSLPGLPDPVNAIVADVDGGIYVCVHFIAAVDCDWIVTFLSRSRQCRIFSGKTFLEVATWPQLVSKKLQHNPLRLFPANWGAWSTVFFYSRNWNGFSIHYPLIGYQNFRKLGHNKER